MRAVSDGRWKLHIYPQINHKLLFDLKNDPDEMSDVAENYPQHVERLTKLMVERQRELGDKQPLTVENPNPKFVDLTGSRRVLDVWQPKWIRDKYYGGRSETDHGAKRVKKR
jgi:arylsulfatase A-like enzyme